MRWQKNSIHASTNTKQARLSAGTTEEPQLALSARFPANRFFSDALHPAFTVSAGSEQEIFFVPTFSYFFPTFRSEFSKTASNGETLEIRFPLVRSTRQHERLMVKHAIYEL